MRYDARGSGAGDITAAFGPILIRCIDYGWPLYSRRLWL